MPKKGRKFIDKKKAVSFHLVNRSQQDPLVADETAPQHVLVPVHNQNEGKRKELKSDKENRIEEQHKYGIYFDDDYNYLQHLKDVKDQRMEWPDNVEEVLEERKAKIQLPSSVFASEVEEKVGMLNKAAPVSGPQLHLDPDVVAAMDEDFDYEDPENQLEDNFIELAEGVASDQEFDNEFDHDDMFDEREEDGYISSDFDDDDMHSGSEKSFSREETKSRITRYSLSSSVLPRNENLTMLDEYFEKKIAEYDDDKIGVLDLEESDEEETPIADALIERYAEEYEKHLEEQSKTALDKDDEAVNRTKHLYKNMNDSDEGEYEIVPIGEGKQIGGCRFVPAPSKNNPGARRKLIDGPNVIPVPSVTKIKISHRTGVPVNELDSHKLALKALDDQHKQNGDVAKSVTGQSIISRLSELSIRSKDETPEEKKRRKHLLREYRRERRIEKKANVLAFKDIAQSQAKIAINNLKNIQGNKIL